MGAQFTIGRDYGTNSVRRRSQVVSNPIINSKASPMKTLLVAVGLLAGQALAVRAGVTIHYEGTLRDSAAVTNVIALVSTFVKTNGWKVEEVHKKDVEEVRVIDEKEVKYKGPIHGVIIRVGEWCEPIQLEFGKDLFSQSYVKTQFAGPEVHRRIVNLLKSIQQHTKALNVSDEGEFWDSGDMSKLKDHMNTVDRMIAEIKRKKPAARGPVKLPTGRIADVVE
jgi:hypothetical protein